MAWVAPRTWVAAETVMATALNEQLRDNLLHLAGSAGFTGTPSSTAGIQPAAGYFLGSRKLHYHIEGGIGIASGGGTVVTSTFVNPFAAAPAVIVTPLCTGTLSVLDTQMFTSTIGVNSFNAYKSNVPSSDLSFCWLAWGSDT